MIRVPERRKRFFRWVLGLAVIGTCLTVWKGADDGLTRLRVSLPGRSISKLPFVIAADQGVFEKHGLDVRLEMASPDFEGGIESRADDLITRGLVRLKLHDPPPAPPIIVDGGTPFMVRRTIEAREPDLIAVAGTDCVLRSHIVARPGISNLEELKGKRIGISYLRATTGFGALVLAERMGWDPVQDISIMLSGRDADALREGLVDAIVATDRAYAAVKDEGFSILVDTKDWNEPLAGNSVLVGREWLSDPSNRGIAKRFLMAVTEAIALFHEDRELALDVLARWNGVRDRAYAETMYQRGVWTPREPFPCYEGIQRTIEVYDSNEMRRYSPEDFYDDSLMREIVESGFVESLYR